MLRAYQYEVDLSVVSLLTPVEQIRFIEHPLGQMMRELRSYYTTKANKQFRLRLVPLANHQIHVVGAF